MANREPIRMLARIPSPPAKLRVPDSAEPSHARLATEAYRHPGPVPSGLIQRLILDCRDLAEVHNGNYV